MTDETPAPDVSVVIPCYNAERWVGRAIDSVLAQEGVTVEVIVIDDGSTDGSVDVLRRYEGRIHWETGPNRGACAVRNRGLALARADYVVFLDADDYVEGPFLKSMKDQLDSWGCDCVIGMVADASEGNAPKPRTPPSTQSWEALIVDWLCGNFVPPCGLMWRKKYIRNIRGWNESLSKNQDGEILLRAASQRAIFQHCANGRAIYWHHASDGRISNVKTQQKFFDSLSVYLNLAKELEKNQSLSPDIDKALSRATHGIERAAAKAGLTETAREISHKRRLHMWKRYDGSTLHNVACHILGLPLKEFIAGAVNQLKLQYIHRRKPAPISGKGK